MDSHFYLIAQLPGLIWEEPLPLAGEDFLAEAEKWLSAAQYGQLASILAPDNHSALAAVPALPEWNEHEAQLREDVLAWRYAQRQGHAPQLILLSPEELSVGTPLDVELRLLQRRWNRAEDLAAMHHFDWEAVLLYAIRLRLMIERAVFEPNVGMQRFNELTKARMNA